jgi:hypothetical protein
MSNETQSAAAGEIVATGPIVAKAGRYYRVARYLMTLLLIAYGAWSIYDGFYSWPNWPITHPRERPKTDTDIALNKILGVVLPPVGIGVLVWALYSSRGQYRLENGLVTVPGHPPVPLDKIQSVDRELWDRKGIAYIEYDLSESPQQRTRGNTGAPVAYEGVKKGATGTFKLDDFVYERDPTDQIFKIIEASLLKAASAAPPIQPPAAKLPPRPTLGTKR